VRRDIAVLQRRFPFDDILFYFGNIRKWRSFLNCKSDYVVADDADDDDDDGDK